MLCSLRVCVILLFCSNELVCVKQAAEMFPMTLWFLHSASLIPCLECTRALPGVYESNSPDRQQWLAGLSADCVQYCIDNMYYRMKFLDLE